MNQSDQTTERLDAETAGISRAAELLQTGQLVAFPSETVYGLGGDARNADAVAAIFEAKNRPSFNPLIVHVASLKAARDIAHVPRWAEPLAAAFWPGALTLVLPSLGVLPDIVTAGHPTIAVRVPAHPVALALLEAFDGPLAGPSANPSGRISPTTAEHVADGLTGRIAGILDGGSAPVGVESTIIGGEPPTLLRPGGISVEDIEAVLCEPLRPHSPAQIPNTPGQLTSHYAPTASVRLNAETAQGKEILLGFGAIKGEQSLSPSGDLREAAAQLFAKLRALDRQGRPIAVAPIPDHGLGRAINDRLRRAAAPRHDQHTMTASKDLSQGY